MWSNYIIYNVFNNELQNDKIEHATLSALKQFPIVHSLSIDSIEQRLECLPSWLWTYPISDFVNTCTKPQTASFCEVSERIFLINHAVLIFKSLGNQTNRLCLNWCKSQLQQQTYQARVMINIGQIDEMALRFVNGFGFDKNGNERLILEVSGGHAANDQKHACDVTRLFTV
ncbi:hypothetical protein J3Q64DRAFT_1817828 [Phycomyces blakesleeanus]|uniref:Uncharacterized protein n=1 Tax=Phycomyces blakesleeanus TaxID=4837 RepID=A0ABR3BHC7_PHYBL